MARGRSKPTVVNNQLHYALANGVQYIDIFRDLSAINRKLIRQGRIAYVTDISYIVHTANDGNGGQLIINALPNDWVTNNAWKKAQAHWLAQQRDTRKLVGQSGKPTWEDFKVYYDASHRTGTTLAVPGLSYGEWVYSKMVYDDGSLREPNCHVQGDDVAATDVGLVLNYQKSRATVQVSDPELPDEYSHNVYAYMAEAENDVADEIAQNMEYDNDQSPYDQNDYPGNDSNGVIGHNVMMIASPLTSSVVNDNSVICAPLGLLRLLHQGINAANGESATAPTGFLTFRIAYGNYKGLAAPSFGQ
jgi:hypothetical protein